MAQPAPVYDCEDSGIVLRYGSRGGCVYVVQSLLNIMYNAGLVEDSSYGPATTTAVRQFQARYGLTVDGIFGPKSWAALSGAYYNMVHGWPY
ncbi:MAG: hypothetical protein HGA44_12955 [Cellulomonadaceae bacterium]|nr:hypothetical protein [Cellulomonadaceae bacterium]